MNPPGTRLRQGARRTPGYLRRALGTAGALCLAGGLLAPGAGGVLAPGGALQEGGAPDSQERGAGREPRVAVALVPDSVRVGEPFLLGIAVETEPGSSVRFPPLLPTVDGLEQRAGARVRAQESGEWRVYYRLTAWRPGVLELPALEIGLGPPEADRSVRVRPPAVAVRSVLPAEGEVELRAERPFLAGLRVPWWWIGAGLLLAAVLATWWVRRRAARKVPPDSVSPGPGEAALEELARLRRDWTEGRLEVVELFDGLEGVLRSYAEATRGWAPGWPLRNLPNGNRALGQALARSALVRFARLDASGEWPDAVLDVCEGWVRADLRLPPVGAPGGETGGERA